MATQPSPFTPTIWMARPRGFCAGVDRAIAIVEGALAKYGQPVYVKHAIVHNRHVVQRLERMGAVFVEELEQAPEGAHLIFSAHGVSPAVRQAAEARRLKVLDATCPLVTKVHVEARQYAKQELSILLIGHRNHVEVKGTLGEAPAHTQVVETVEEARQVRVADPERVAYLTQTTLSLDDTAEILAVLKQRFPKLATPGKEDICYATQNRQTAVKALAKKAGLILVVGSSHSSNSNRLVEVARALGARAELVESASDVQEAWLQDYTGDLGITAGASAPEAVVQELVEQLARRFKAAVQELQVVEEEVVFPLPSALREA